MSGLRVLVVGGYGGFGARLARRLAGDGWQVLVAGRSADKARAFAASLANGEGVVFDRNADCAAQLAALRTDLVIDATGPFQGLDYRLPKACIANRISYFDLADGRDFVCGIGALDREARAARVVVIAGASTLPALSAAVVRHLTAGMNEVAAIESAITATTRASSGQAVVGAALSYAGKAVALRRGGRWQNHPGWSLLRRERFEVAGVKPLRRLVALADVPDLALFPEMFAGKPATVFRGGSEFSLQMLALALLGIAVARGWLRSAAPLTRWLAPVQQAMARLGGDRSAMAIEVRGETNGAPVVRRWTVIAERGEGQEIPVLVAQLLARRFAVGTLAAGARHAGGELELADFEPLLAGLAVKSGWSQHAAQLPYRRVLGERFAALAAPLMALHAPLAEMSAQGQARVERGTSPLARLIAWLVRFPPSGDYPLEVQFEPRDGKERWTRSFGPHAFSSELSATPDGLLTERFGPLRFDFALEVSDQGGIAMILRRWTVLGVPLPLALAPRITAREWAEGDAFAFDVAIAVPLAGPVVHYCGTLRPAS